MTMVWYQCPDGHVFPGPAVPGRYEVVCEYRSIDEPDSPMLVPSTPIPDSVPYKICGKMATVKTTRFHLDRSIDESGMSGTGRVAEGVVLPTGIAIMWWLRPPFTMGVYPSLDELEKLHGHNKGTTRVVMEK